MRDHRYMEAAARLASYHLGQTGQNPAVGALIVRQEGKGWHIVGRGVTALGGRPHAEPQALDEAGARARGATAYVTLEPCSHIGQTPPCVDALIAARVARVVVGVLDPDPRVAGQGIKRLQEAGIEVTIGVAHETVIAGLSAYLHGKIYGRPEVTLKLAISADGHIGHCQRGSFIITGEVSRAQSHIMRAQHDAILIGIGTAISDNPRLDCRLNGLAARSPLRLVLDSQLRLPPTSQLVDSAATMPLWVIGMQGADVRRMKQLQAKGVEVVLLPEENREICLSALMAHLAQKGINSLLIEGGAKIARSFWQAGLVDRLALFQSPIEIGAQGYAAPTLAGKTENYRQVVTRQFGQDIYQEWRKITPCLPASLPI